MTEYFQELIFRGGRVKFDSDFPNYATKADLKNPRGVNTSNLAEKVDLASLKSNVDQLDIDKLKKVPSNISNLKSKIDKLDVVNLLPVLAYLSKLSDTVKKHVIKKDVDNAHITNIEDEIPDITDLATNTTLNAKINDVKKEIPGITNFATTATLTAVENKITNVRNLVKKLTITQKVVKLKIILLLIMIMINILLLNKSIS